MYRLSGRLAYALVKPAIRRYIKNSRRSYALVTRGDDVLLVHNWLGNGAWTLPGGGAHAKETYNNAVAREVYEEIGVTVDTSAFTLITHGTWASNGFDYTYEISSVRVGDDVRLRKRFLEITDARFINIDTAITLPNIAPEITQALSALRAAGSA